MQALLHCAKNSMNMLKNRIQSRTYGAGAFLFVQKPFFEVTNTHQGTISPRTSGRLLWHPTWVTVTMQVHGSTNR